MSRWTLLVVLGEATVNALLNDCVTARQGHLVPGQVELQTERRWNREFLIFMQTLRQNIWMSHAAKVFDRPILLFLKFQARFWCADSPEKPASMIILLVSRKRLWRLLTRESIFLGRTRAAEAVGM